MTGDLKAWKGADLAVDPSVKFERRGGWFVTKAQVVGAALFMVVLVLAAILFTKYFTEEHLKGKDSETEKIVSSLRENINPISYDLLYNHSSQKFDSEMSLIFTLQNSTNKIVLKFKGESVVSAHLEVFDKSNETISHELAIQSMVYNKDDSEVEIMTSEMLPAEGHYNLTIKFVADINPEEKGFFKIPYKYSENGTKLEDRWIIGTQLAPAYCSLAFPCVDVSSDRPIFRLKIVKPKNVLSISNVLQKAVKDIADVPELQLDDYEWTPPMPYSSLALYLLPDYKVKTLQNSKTGLNIWYPAHLENTTTPIAEAAGSLMAFYSDFFNSSLPLHVVSIVLIDGLVTDRPGTLGVIPISSNLLYSLENGTFKREEKLFYYLGRKLCNQWLGNIVNFKSFADSWLSEGLALYLTDVAASHNFLSYDVSTFLSVQEKALEEEKFINSQYFYDSPYKGAFLFHMLARIMPPSAFKTGIQGYIKKLNLNSTEPADLWHSLNSVQDKIDVLNFINSWSKKGYPVVSVNYENGTMSLQQDPVSEAGSEVNKLWHIPITYIAEEEFDFDHTDFQTWLNEKKSMISGLQSNGSWIIVNPHFAGFFRTNYSKSLWEKIEDQLSTDSSRFPSTVKAQLLDDSFALASYGVLDYSVPLNLSLYLKEEKNITPWTTVMKHLNYLSLFLKPNNTEYETFKMYLEKLINNTFTGLGFSSVPKERPIDKYLRAELLRFSCRHDLSNDSKKLSPELRSTAYCFGNRLHGRNSSTKLVGLSRTYIVEPYEEFDILRSITCTSDLDDLKRFLQLSVDVDNLDFSAKRTVEIWLSLSEIPENSQAAFEFVKSNWSSILAKFKKESDILEAILEGSTYALTEESHLDDLTKMKTEINSLPRHGPETENILDAMIERVKFNVEWRKNNLKHVHLWLKNFNNNVSTSPSSTTQGI